MPLEHATLAFLEAQPMSGYDLKKIFDLSVAHLWSATQSHIYKALDDLEEKGWAKAALIPQEGRPNRHEYTITDAGRAELHRWLTTPLPLEHVRQAWLIQIFFSHVSSNEEIAALLETRLKNIQERIRFYREEGQASIDQNAKEVGIERARVLSQMTLDYGIAYYQFELTWGRKMLEQVKDLPVRQNN
jgi:PadR family transcriptional regulator AphA